MWAPKLLDSLYLIGLLLTGIGGAIILHGLRAIRRRP